MKYYKVYTDYSNYIPIDETELEKAMRAFQSGAGAIFNNGATRRIDIILPDDVRMMGWNAGYKPTAEELGEIGRDRICQEARRLMTALKEHLALGSNEPFKLEAPRPRIYSTGGELLGNLLKKRRPRQD